MRARRTIGDGSPLNPHTPCRAARCPPFLPTARRGLGHGRQVSAPRAGTGMPRGVAMGGVTPRQACPRPSGLGRNLRSKTRWFAGFCNSHQVSHFATFFIDARAEISVAESRLIGSQAGGGSPRRRRVPCRGALSPGGAAALSASIPWRWPRPEGCCSGLVGTRAPGSSPGPRAASDVSAGLVRRWWF